MKHIDLKEIENLNLSLESLDERIAMEAGFISGIATTIRDVVPNIIFAARKAFANIKGLDKHDLRFLDVNYRILERVLGNDTFVNISGLPVVIPEGMSSPFNEVCVSVQKLVNYANNTQPRLTDYAKFISTVISSQDGRKALNDYSTLMKAVDKERDNTASYYNACFQAGSTKAITDYGKAIENNTLWLSCNQTLLETIEQAKLYKVKDISNLVSEVSILLDNLNERIKAGTVLDMSPETLRSLSAMTVTMAREVELYALTMYRLSEVKKCYELSCKNLIKALNK